MVHKNDPWTRLSTKFSSVTPEVNESWSSNAWKSLGWSLALSAWVCGSTVVTQMTPGGATANRKRKMKIREKKKMGKKRQVRIGTGWLTYTLLFVSKKSSIRN